tara:strand:+ start:115 stop:807 length:693 start_codon:yes stop_codon:yes gene_type:complete
MARTIGQKNALTAESKPFIIELLTKFKEQNLTLKEQVPLFQEAGYEISCTGTLRNWKKKFGLSDQKYAPTGKIVGNQNLEFIEDEVWKPIITDRYDASEYQISQYGNVLGKRGQKLKWWKSNGYMKLSLHLKPSDFTSDFIPQSQDIQTDRRNQNIAVHRIVAELFLPKPVPLRFSQLWPTLDKKQRDWIQSVYIVDHIDNDRSNPHVDNLRWVTTRENNKYVKAAKYDD